MNKLMQPLRWTRLSAVSLSLIFLLAAAAFAATPLGAQAPLGGPLFYQAELTGDSVMPPVASGGSGAFAGEGEERGSEIRFKLTASASGITQVHIHLGGPDENGGVAAFLFGLSDPPVDDVNIDGVLTEADLLGSVAGDWEAFVEALFTGAYVQVHTTDNPAGELRGQIVIALTDSPLDPGEGVPDPPGPPPLSLDAFLEAVVDAGFGPLQLQEIAVTQPWIPVPSAGVLILAGAQAEVYSLSAAQAEQAINNISGEAPAFQPPANATVWRSLELIVILRDAPSNSVIEAALFNILGPPVLATITGGVPPPPGSGEDDGAVPEPTTGESVDAPELLPNTGNGGLAGDGQGSGLVLSLLAAGIAVTASLAGLTLRRRRLT